MIYLGEFIEVLGPFIEVGRFEIVTQEKKKI